MGWTVRHAGLLAPVFGCLIFFAGFDGCAHAQTQTPAPGKEVSPFDWLRHDAPAVNRPAGPTLNPPTDGPVEQKRPDIAQPMVEEAIPVASENAPGEPALIVDAAPTPDVPAPIARPATVAATIAASKAKAPPPPPQPTEQISVLNSRSVTLNELKLVSLKNSRKPFIVRPSLKGGQSMKIDIPKDWGCVFLVWTQFSEEPSEQYDGVDLCVDKMLNLVN